ncbi:hypothetical protein CPC08DRAFT_747903 [Agrocybe pediades]|nr:hypothetical protein CPC08DRAFT_747903 [Agrocybe pediades]
MDNNNGFGHSRIPFELFRTIFEFIDDKQTLVALALTSSVVSAEAEPILYRSMLNTTAAAQGKFLRVVSRDRVRAGYVRQYATFGTREPWILTEGVRKALLDLLSVALAKMVNLKSFHLDFGAHGARSEDTLRAFLNQSFPFQLDEFHGFGLYRPPQLPELVRFLSSQTKLRRLSLLRHHLANTDYVESLEEYLLTNIEDTHTPDLVYLRGRLPLLLAFLPRRNITMAVWTLDPPRRSVPPGFSQEEGARRLAPHFKKLTYLSVGYTTTPAKSWDPPFCFILTHILPNLECLELYQFDYDQDAVLFLKRIPSLRMFIIPASTAMVIWSPGQMDFPVYGTAQDVLLACPQVRFGAQVSAVSKDGSSPTEYIYTVWDSMADARDPPAVYRVPPSALQMHHIFELLPH